MSQLTERQAAALTALAWKVRATDPTTARRFCEAAISAQPRNAHAWLVLGLLLGERRETGPALAALGRALTIDPKLIDAHMAVADLRFELGDYTGALKAIEACIALDPAMRNPNGVRARTLAVRMRKQIERRIGR